MRYDSNIFENVLEDDVCEDIKAIDITESIHFDVNDENIDRSNCSLIAYNIHVDEDDNIESYNPKKNPDKAIDILLEYPEMNLKIEIYLNTLTKEWDSLINDEFRLSPE